MNALVLHVRLHDGRYHGEGDWPPSPARLFQALVAGAGLSGPIEKAQEEALRWLEELDPPLVAAPNAWRPRRGVLLYMPNNDSDAIGGDPVKMAKIRTATKVFRPWFFDAAVPFVYAWRLFGKPGEEDQAKRICSLAERLYQFGRGIDMAWAWGEILDDRDLNDLLTAYPGRVFRPSTGQSETTLSSHCLGSLRSLEARHLAFSQRFHYVKDGKSVRVIFRKPPMPRFRPVSYDSPPSSQLYELRDPATEEAFAPWPLVGASSLVVRLRDAAVERLARALPAQKAHIERALVGRKPDGTNDIRPEERVRILPLPSIGHVHADREIRRVLVEVPPACPLRADDVQWAFSGLEVVDAETGEIRAVLTPTDEEGFLRHYGGGGEERARVWRTVTPAAFPLGPGPRQTGGAHRLGEGNALDRAEKEARAAAAVFQALRHAGVRAKVESVRVQREPFEAHGARAEDFAKGTRFPPNRLWHVEVAFDGPVEGPFAVGDGRFLGLGVMAPHRGQPWRPLESTFSPSKGA